MADSGFLIDGQTYEVPDLETFNMDEAMILYDNSKLGLEDFALDEDDPKSAEQLKKNLLHPGYVRTLMTVAYLRGNQGLGREKAEAVIGGSSWFDAYQSYAEKIKAADAGPPEMTPEPEGDADGTTSTSSGHSGDGSTSGSAEPGEIPVPTGTTESDMSQDKGQQMLARGSRLT